MPKPNTKYHTRKVQFREAPAERTNSQPILKRFHLHQCSYKIRSRTVLRRSPKPRKPSDHQEDVKDGWMVPLKVTADTVCP